MNFFISGKVEDVRKKKNRKMGYIHTIFIAIITICCIKYFSSFRKDNQQLYGKIVDYFFHKELRNTKIEMNQYLRCSSHIYHVAARCNHFHLLQNCSMRIPNMSLVTMRNNSLTVQINRENSNRTIFRLIEQYLPFIEGFRVFFRRRRNMNR